MLRNREAIELWTKTEDGLDLTDHVGIIGSLFESCLRLLNLLLVEVRKVKLTQFNYKDLENSMRTLFFWGEELGVSCGDLDKALVHAEETRDLTLSVLISLGDFLSHDLLEACLSHSECSDILRESAINMQIDKARGIVMDWEESVREKPSSVEDLYTTLNAKVARLNVLGQILEDPVPNIFEAEEARTLNSLQDRPAHQYFVDLVGSRFPHAEDRLVEKLGRSNWNRYNHVQKQRESAKDELEVVSTNKAKSVFHDSGIGSSAPAQSEYAATVISSRAGASHKRLPSLPEKARSGQPFKCDVCDSAVKIRRIKEWKKHIFRDICAYTCIFSECPLVGVLFEDREAMTNHLESQHEIDQNSPSQACPLCLEQIFGGRDLISLHFARHMEEIALAVLPRSSESEDGSEAGENGSEEVENDSAEFEDPRLYPPFHLRGIEEDQTTLRGHPQPCPEVNPGVTESSAPTTPKLIPKPQLPNYWSHLNDTVLEEPKREKTKGQGSPSHTPTPQQQTAIEPLPPGTQVLPPHREPHDYDVTPGSASGVVTGSGVLQSPASTSPSPFPSSPSLTKASNREKAQSQDGKLEPSIVAHDPRGKSSQAALPIRCASCNRAETPEWRRGPDGSRNLCNACGLHYAKLTRKMAAQARRSMA